jgi:sigma-B regulation protein RsbU (phosphoserine phosphatase)
MTAPIQLSETTLLVGMCKRAGSGLMLAYLVTRSRWFRQYMNRTPTSRDTLVLLGIFGALGAYSGMTGVVTRDIGATLGFIGPMVGGLLGGPLVGVGAAVITDLYLGFFETAVARIPTLVDVLIAGLAGGVFHALTTRRTGRYPNMAQAALLMAGMQVFHLAQVVFMSHPLEAGLALVKYIGLPMICGTTLGTALFFFLRNLLKEKATQDQRDAYLAQKQKIEGELGVAREIQLAMVPKMLPKTPDWPECGLYADLNSAREVGGDFYDFFLDKDGKLVIAIGDVSDKGVPAALFMAVTKTLLKGMSEPGQMPHELLEKVNREVAESNELNMFVTIFCAKLDLATGELWYSNAGHNPPVLLRKGQRPEWLDLPPGLVLGALPMSVFRTGKILLNPGDALFTYTDGVTEAMDPASGMFSEERLIATLKPLAGAAPKELVEAVGTAVKAFAAGAPQSDDVTMLALRYRGKA